MTEETYQEVIDKIKEEDGEKDEKEYVKEDVEKCKTIVEEKEEHETTDFELETKPVEKVAMKKKQPSCRAKLRDKVTCPKCGKELSRHSYEYTHSKFCKGINRKPLVPSDDEGSGEEEDVKEITNKMEQMTITELVEETKPKPKPKAKPIAKPHKVEDKPTEYVPTDDDIKRYLSNIRKEKAMRKQQGYDQLISNAF